MLRNIKPVPFHESDKHIFAKIPGGVRTPGPPSGSAHVYYHIAPIMAALFEILGKIVEKGEMVVTFIIIFAHNVFQSPPQCPINILDLLAQGLTSLHKLFRSS